MTFVFMILVASFLLGIYGIIADAVNRNDNNFRVVSICFVLIVLCSTILFYHFTH